MDPLYQSASFILDRTQPQWDGGIFPILIQTLFPSNDSKAQSPGNQVIQRLTSKGYLTGLVCGILWAVLLIFVSVFFFIMHCRRKKNTKTNLAFKMMARKIEKAKRQWSSHWMCLATQFIILFVLIFLISAAAILSAVSTNKLRIALTSQSGTTGLFPRSTKAIGALQVYFKKFADRSQADSRPVIDEIIYATEVMQNETMQRFNKILFKALGVEDTFRLGNIMVENIVSRFKLARNISDQYYNLHNHLREMNKIFDYIRYPLLDRSSSNSVCSDNASCQSDLKTLSELLFINMTTYDYMVGPGPVDGVKSFLYVMKSQNKTDTSIREEMEYGQRKSNEMIDKMYLRMKHVLDIPGSIRNMTDEIWTKSSKDLIHQSEQIGNISHVLNSKVHPIVAKYTNYIMIPCILVIIILIGTICLTSPVVVHNYCAMGDFSDVRRNLVKLLLYSELFLLMPVVLISMFFFLSNGYLHTEVCRYIGKNQELFGMNQSLKLDIIIGSFLDENWEDLQSKMPKMDIPLPKPQNVLSGVLNECREDKGLFLALHALKDIDPAVLSQPALAERFVRLGRGLMIDQLNETDPRDMMPAGMTDNLNQAKSLDSITTTEEIKNISPRMGAPLFLVSLKNYRSNFYDFVNKYFTVLGFRQRDRDNYDNLFNKLEISYKTIPPLIWKFKPLPTQLYDIAPVKPVAEELISSLKKMTNLMLDKRRCLEVANGLYQTHIADTTPEQAAKVMHKFGHKVLSKVGRCRSIYEAFSEVESAVCSDISGPFGGLWFTFGWGVLLATPLTILVLAMMTKKHSPSHSPTYVVEHCGDNKNLPEVVEMLPPQTAPVETYYDDPHA